MRTDLLKGHLDLVLLSCLREGPAHGYLISQRLRERSRGEFDLLEGTLYPALHRLEASDAVSSKWSSESGRRRRIYQLTRKGSEALASRENEWRQFASTVNLVLGGAS
ncbi:MAG: transcriptional regulator, PadR-like family [Thermoleophilia bacterium]|nr:transcriptional regulator, PadR-like family [Thermoleophilia bacterium]